MINKELETRMQMAQDVTSMVLALRRKVNINCLLYTSANRGDYQNGWDTDQFPIDNYELTQAMMQIIRNGGFGNGGTKMCIRDSRETRRAKGFAFVEMPDDAEANNVIKQLNGAEYVCLLYTSVQCCLQ